MFDDLAPAEVLAAVAGTDFAMAEPIDVMGGRRIDAIAALERLVRAAQALQAEQTAALLADRRSVTPFGMGDPFLSVAAEVAMARGMSPSSGIGLLNVALGLRPMVNVRTALTNGVINEATMRAIVRESDTLDPAAAGDLDAAIAEHLPGLTPRRAAELTRSLVVTIDMEAAVEREKQERKNQYVTYVGEAHGMGTLIARGPAEQLLLIRDSLAKHADTLRAKGDPRDRGQIMLNSLFERATGQVVLDGPDTHLDILMPIEALQGEPVAAELAGHGPITPHLAAELVDQAGQAWFRRLFTDPTGTLVGLDTRRRCFTGLLAKWIHTRDHHRCRQPSCECRSREVDHIQAHSRGGPTTQTNGQGVCKLSHQVKELPGWNVRAHTDGQIEWTTPTGHQYVSPAPRRAQRE
ncbi:HNH endonuclease signature motif containing protein [Aeromicrobium sp. Leaf350]|uniref:HNH endonuclease n=1 Tax=Aeromicrobium sp. Leaf350 TaxID=2876565 RepID=UPI001E3DDE87|nr:HNH endonuclease signature motif containing protein [Aeromicrobium sp. Leaf350]